MQLSQMKEKTIDHLVEVGPFEDVDSYSIKSFLNKAVEKRDISCRKYSRKYKKCEFIENPHDLPHIHIIVEGLVAPIFFDEKGEQCITEIYSPGEVFSRMGIENNDTKNVFLECYRKEVWFEPLTSNTIVYKITPSKYCQLLDEYPKVKENVACQDLVRDRRSQLRSYFVYKKRPNDRGVRYFFYELSQRTGEPFSNGILVEVPFEKSIGYYINCSRERVSREITKLKNAGMIIKGGMGKEAFIYLTSKFFEEMKKQYNLPMPQHIL